MSRFGTEVFVPLLSCSLGDADKKLDRLGPDRNGGPHVRRAKVERALRLIGEVGVDCSALD